MLHKQKAAKLVAFGLGTAKHNRAWWMSHRRFGRLSSCPQVSDRAARQHNNLLENMEKIMLTGASGDLNWLVWAVVLG